MSYENLTRKLTSGEAVVAGVLSGTSADGIDCALCRMVSAGAPELLAFQTLPFDEVGGPEDEIPSEPLRDRLRQLLDGAAMGPRELALFSRDLGRAFGRAVARVSRDCDLSVDLIGSHGQTVYHHDGLEGSGAATLQIGDGDFVAFEAGAPVVSDFRQADIAAGGEGAPLTALCDDELFAELVRPAAILNLGGIANLTLLSERGTPPVAFDTGPACSLLDGLSRRLLGSACDFDGACASRGRPAPALVAELLEHPFFLRPPPKSTGRDTFGLRFVELVIDRSRFHGLDPEGRPEAVLASAVAFIGESIALGLERFAPAIPESLVLCGGGVRNRALVGAIERASSSEMLSSTDFGVSPDAREAICFALLAVRFALEIPSTREPVTGASEGSVLGKLSWWRGETRAFDSSPPSFP